MSDQQTTEITHITPAARIIVAELILQEAIDELPGKRYYRQQVKYHANQLSKELKGEVEKTYKRLEDESESGLNSVWQLYHNTADLLGKLPLNAFHKVLMLVSEIAQMDNEQAAALLTIIQSYRAGNVYAVNDEESINLAIEQGALKSM